MQVKHAELNSRPTEGSTVGQGHCTRRKLEMQSPRERTIETIQEASWVELSTKYNSGIVRAKYYNVTIEMIQEASWVEYKVGKL